MTRTAPSGLTITFCGLKSRWMIPARCAAASPRPAIMKTRRISSRVRRLWSSHAATVSPSISSIATNTRPPAEPTSYTVTRLGCDSFAIARASRIIRAASISSRVGVAAHDFDRDLSIEIRIVRGIDLAHAAAADQVQQPIAPDRCPRRSDGADSSTTGLVVPRSIGGARRTASAAAALAGGGPPSTGGAPAHSSVIGLAIGDWHGDRDQRRAVGAPEQVALDLRQPRPAERAAHEGNHSLLVETAHPPRASDDSLGTWRVRKSQRLPSCSSVSGRAPVTPPPWRRACGRSSRSRSRRGPIWRRSVRLVVHLAHVVGDDVAQGLADLFVEDFALGLACVDRRPGALTQVERLWGRRSTPLSRASIAARSCATRCARRCGSACSWGHRGRRRGSLSYAGRGPLAGWVAVAAQRIALDLRRAATRAAGSDPLADQLLPSEDTPRSTTCAIGTSPSSKRRSRRAGRAARSRSLTVAAHDRQWPLPRTESRASTRSTSRPVSRWIARTRAEVLEATERTVCGKLGVERDEFMSLAGLLVSRIDLSISRVLETSSPE